MTTHQKISWTQIMDDQGNYWKIELSKDSTDLLNFLGKKAIKNSSHKAREVSGAVLVTATKQ
jgi:hypothetical protein